MIRILCPKCKRQIDLEDFRAGHVGRCLQCQQKFRVPGARRDARGQATREHRSLAQAPPLAIRVGSAEEGSSTEVEVLEDFDVVKIGRKEPPASTPAGTKFRAGKSRKKKKKGQKNWLVWAIVLVALGLLAALAGVFWFLLVHRAAGQ